MIRCRECDDGHGREWMPCMHTDMHMICAYATAARKFELLMGCRPCSPPCHSAAGPAWQPTPSKFPSTCSAFSTGPNRLKLSRRRVMAVTRPPTKLHAIWNPLKFDAVDA